MSQFDYPIACSDCDYEATAKSLKVKAMYKRMHTKKCKKTGRTKKVEVMADQSKKIEVALQLGGSGIKQQWMFDQMIGTRDALDALANTTG